MSKTQLWSLQFSCRRLAREARRLGNALDRRGAVSRQIEQHLNEVSQLIAASMEPRADGNPPGPGAPDLSAQALTETGLGTAGAGPHKPADESPPSPLHQLAMHLSASFLATPDVITFLCSSQKSGALLVDTGSERFAVEFDRGDIVHAHSDASPAGERLGDVLVESGVITGPQLAEQLAAGTVEQAGERLRLGARLQARQLATKAQLLAALETQIRRIFHRLFTAQALDFAFWEGPCIWGELSMRLNTTMLLLDGARAVDESKRNETPLPVSPPVESWLGLATPSPAGGARGPQRAPRARGPKPEPKPEPKLEPDGDMD